MNKCTRCGEVNPAEIHTCSPQPEPLIRADELEAIGAESSLARAMAAHTIRLLYEEKSRLDALNAELMEALGEAHDLCLDAYCSQAREVIGHALDKAKEQP